MMKMMPFLLVTMKTVTLMCVNVTVVSHCVFDDVWVFLAQRSKQIGELERPFVTQLSAHICHRPWSRRSVGDAQLGPITATARLQVGLMPFWLYVQTLAVLKPLFPARPAC